MAGHSKWSEIKRQKGLTETRDRARQAGLSIIGRGERPSYRAQVEADGDLFLIRIPELDIATQAGERHEIGGTARDLIATWLDVPAHAFDLEIEVS